MVYRGQGTSGGSDILGRILNHRLGISISQAYLITDTLIVLLAGFVFDWEHALYGLVMIYVSGLAAEVVVEGTDVFRTAIIVTNCTAGSSQGDPDKYGKRSDLSYWERELTLELSARSFIVWLPDPK